jgi:magnesium chelatase subunit I
MMERMGHIDLASIVAWFDGGGALKIAGDEKTDTCLKGFSVVPGLVTAVVAGELAERSQAARTVAGCELILEGLAAQKKITRSDELGYSRIRPERKKDQGHSQGGINFA